MSLRHLYECDIFQLLRYYDEVMQERVILHRIRKWDKDIWSEPQLGTDQTLARRIRRPRSSRQTSWNDMSDTLNVLEWNARYARRPGIPAAHWGHDLRLLHHRLLSTLAAEYRRQTRPTGADSEVFRWPCRVTSSVTVVCLIGWRAAPFTFVCICCRHRA